MALIRQWKGGTRWQNAPLIAGAFVLAVAGGLIAARSPLLALLVIAALAGLALLSRPKLTFYLLYPLIGVAWQEFTAHRIDVAGFPFNGLDAVMALWLAAALLVAGTRRLALFDEATGRLLGMLLLWYTIVAVLGVASHDVSLYQLSQTYRLYPYTAIAYVCTLLFVQDRADLGRFMLVAILAGLMTMRFEVFSYLSAASAGDPEVRQVGSAVSGVLAIGLLSTCITFYPRLISRNGHLLGPALIVLVGIGVAISRTRTQWFAVVVELLISAGVAFLSGRLPVLLKRVLVPVVIFIAIALFIPFVRQAAPLIQERAAITLTSRDPTAAGRFDAILINLDHTFASPGTALFGLGFGPASIDRYQYNSLYIPRGVSQTYWWLDAHNAYSWQLGVGGVIGFVIFMAFLIAPLFSLHRAYRLTEDPMLRAMAIAIFTGLIGLSMYGWGVGLVVSSAPSLGSLTAMAVALERISRKESAEQHAEPPAPATPDRAESASVFVGLRS